MNVGELMAHLKHCDENLEVVARNKKHNGHVIRTVTVQTLYELPRVFLDEEYREDEEVE